MKNPENFWLFVFLVPSTAQNLKMSYAKVVRGGNNSGFTSSNNFVPLHPRQRPSGSRASSRDSSTARSSSSSHHNSETSSSGGYGRQCYDPLFDGVPFEHHHHPAMMSRQFTGHDFRQDPLNSVIDFGPSSLRFGNEYQRRFSNPRPAFIQRKTLLDTFVTRDNTYWVNIAFFIALDPFVKICGLPDQVGHAKAQILRMLKTRVCLFDELLT